MAPPLVESPTAPERGTSEPHFDEVEAEARERRRTRICRLLAEAVDLHLSPVNRAAHFEAVRRLLDGAYADYEQGELEEALNSLLESGRIEADRFGRVLPRRRPNSPIDIARTFDRIKQLAAELGDTEPLSGFEASFSTRERVLGHDVPSAAEERRLTRRAAQGDRAAINQMVVGNMRLAAHLTRSYYRHTGAMDRDDFLQEGALGLIRAAEKFDAGRGFRFSTYASWWIRQSARRAASEKGRTIRIPVHADERLLPLLAFAAKYRETAEIEPSRAEIADAFDLDASEVDRLMELPIEVERLNRQQGDRGDGHDPGVGPRFEDVTLVRLRASLLREAIADLLPDKHRAVLVRRFGLLGNDPETLDEIGRDLGITRERVRQVQQASLKVLRHRLGPVLLED
jgi:RNA polymerase nonessential primary-like sigma factor